MPTSQEQNSGSETLVEIPDENEDSSKYDHHRVEVLDNKVFDIVTPREAFSLAFGDSQTISSSKIDKVKNEPQWVEKVRYFYKILLQI